MTPEPSIQRLEDLLAQQATEGLSPVEEAELAKLLAKWPHVDEESFDYAAGALALTIQPEPVSKTLQSKLEKDAERFFAKQAAPRRLWSAVRWGGAGLIATAACVLLVLWVGGRKIAREDERNSFDRLVADARTVRRPAIDPKTQNPSGEVVWNNAEQKGYLVIDRLPANDPRREQYQLWIFDEKRDQRYPVDGGVFDLDPGKNVIPIQAKLNVVEPVLFAITVEQPGGVVVSDRSRLVWVSKRN